MNGHERFLSDFVASGKNHPPRCQKCGIYRDAKPQPFDDPESICYSFTGYLNAPEPNGSHEWGASE